MASLVQPANSTSATSRGSIQWTPLRGAQRPSRIIIADEKGAEPLPTAFGVGKADDHEFVAIAAFDLEPARAAPRTIWQITAFGENTFEGVIARLAQKSRAAADMMVAEAQHALCIRRNDFTQRLLAVFKRGAREVPAVAIDEVECEEMQ